MQNRLVRATLVAALLAAGSAVAHDGATGVVKQRMDAMGELGDAAKRVGDMYKGKHAFERDAVGDAARVFVRHGEMIPELFPDTEHSRTGSNTEALPSVWDEGAAFEAAAAGFVERSRDLLSAFESDANPMQLKMAFFAAARGCSGCHEDFRAAQE